MSIQALAVGPEASFQRALEAVVAASDEASRELLEAELLDGETTSARRAVVTLCCVATNGARWS